MISVRMTTHFKYSRLEKYFHFVTSGHDSQNPALFSVITTTTTTIMTIMAKIYRVYQIFC